MNQNTFKWGECTWNPVLNKVIEIKSKYMNLFEVPKPDKELYSYTEGESCIERWIKLLGALGITEYEELFKPLQINQYDTLILIRYGRYSDIYGGEQEVTSGEFWNMYDGFYQECRSLTIDIKEEKLVLTPFKKFTNLNETEETALNKVQELIKNARYVEFSDKLDGSMQSARWYNGKIVMAGSQALDKNLSWRLKDGYDRLMAQDNYINMIKSNKDITFIFEYIALKDAHLVKYNKEQEGLYLIGMRSSLSGYEWDYNDVISMANYYEVRTTQVFNKTLEQILEELDNKTSDEAEGFVLNIVNKDNSGLKVKIKYNDYVNLHGVLSQVSSHNVIIRAIADDTYDDLLAKVPEVYHDRVTKTADAVSQYVREMKQIVNSFINDAPQSDRKTFMVWVSNNVPKEFQGYCRATYLGQSINYLRSRNDKAPHYKTLKEMGIDPLDLK